MRKKKKKSLSQWLSATKNIEKKSNLFVACNKGIGRKNTKTNTLSNLNFTTAFKLLWGTLTMKLKIFWIKPVDFFLIRMVLKSYSKKYRLQKLKQKQCIWKTTLWPTHIQEYPLRLILVYARLMASNAPATISKTKNLADIWFFSEKQEKCPSLIWKCFPIFWEKMITMNFIHWRDIWRQQWSSVWTGWTKQS